LLRRLARRGGVKRIAATIYDDVRQALKERLRAVRIQHTFSNFILTTLQILKEAIAVVELTGRKTVSVTDIIFVLNRVSRQISELVRLRKLIRMTARPSDLRFRPNVHWYSLIWLCEHYGQRLQCVLAFMCYETGVMGDMGRCI
jgi:histone H3/H4